MNKVIAVIGAGEAAVPILKKAQEMKIDTICFGEDDSLAKSIPNYFISCSIFDVDKIIEYCLEYKVIGVMASSEITTEIAAIVADKLNLPGNDIKQGFSGRNKFVMREKISKVPVIKQPLYMLYDENQLIDFPVIVKSTDSCGKRGVSLVRDNKELVKAVRYAKKYSTDGDVLIEEYIEGGREFSIECLSSDGLYYVIQITEKEISGPPHFVEIAHHQPANIDNELKRKIHKVSTDILKTLGINCGMSHLELKEKNGEIYFIEIGARAGGDHIGDTLVSLSTDCDYYKAAIKCSIADYKHCKVNNVGYSGIYFYCSANKFLNPLFNIAKKSNWCYQYNIKKRELLDINSNIEAANAGYFIYSADHKIGLKDALDLLNAEVINNRNDSFDLIWNFNKRIGRTLSDEELEIGVNKFISQGNVIALMLDNQIIAMLNLYCNNTDTQQAYICNVEVMKNYRGYGLSKKLIEKAIRFVEGNNFKTIALHVSKANYKAVSLYKRYGFEFTDNFIENDEILHEMILTIK